MTEENVENEVVEEGNEPVYYKPKTLSLVAIIATVTSWLVLVGFILVDVYQVWYLQTIATGQGMTLLELIDDPQAKGYIVTNMIIPFLTGLGMFVLLQVAGIGLNVLLEIDFNLRED
jgi:hypothetical protein